MNNDSIPGSLYNRNAIARFAPLPPVRILGDEEGALEPGELLLGDALFKNGIVQIDILGGFETVRRQLVAAFARGHEIGADLYQLGGEILARVLIPTTGAIGRGHRLGASLREHFGCEPFEGAWALGEEALPLLSQYRRGPLFDLRAFAGRLDRYLEARIRGRLRAHSSANARRLADGLPPPRGGRNYAWQCLVGTLSTLSHKRNPDVDPVAIWNAFIAPALKRDALYNPDKPIDECKVLDQWSRAWASVGDFLGGGTRSTTEPAT